MIKHTVMTAAVLALLAMPALASHCPQDAAAIDHALANMTVADDLKKEVTALKDKGMAAHGAGNHREAESALAEGMRKLLMSIKK
jgi:hypothetical protein